MDPNRDSNRLPRTNLCLEYWHRPTSFIHSGVIGRTGFIPMLAVRKMRVVFGRPGDCRAPSGRVGCFSFSKGYSPDCVLAFGADSIRG